jgi:DNA replication protein DnaC
MNTTTVDGLDARQGWSRFGSGQQQQAPRQLMEYRAWAKRLKRSMRQTHPGGERLFVDYAGQTGCGKTWLACALAQLARLDVLVLDDLAIAPIAAQERQDLLELLDDRVGSRSTLITSQLPSNAWHQWLNEPTIANTIMDRLLHGSHTMALKGESLRRAKPPA